jgi:tetratricopeptide (TPR) repeat protein
LLSIVYGRLLELLYLFSAIKHFLAKWPLWSLVAAILLISVGIAGFVLTRLNTPDRTNIFDPIGVLDQEQVRKVASSLSYPVDIYMDNSAAAKEEIVQRARERLTRDNLIVVVIPVKLDIIIVVYGDKVPLSSAQVGRVAAGFYESYQKSKSNVTKATVDSLAMLQDMLEASDANEKRSKELTAQCDRLFGQKKDEEVLDVCNQAIELDLKNTYAWTHKAQILNVLKRYEEALDASDQAIALDTKNSHGWYSRGRALDFLKRYKQAIASYDRSLELYPKSNSVWYCRGGALYVLKWYEEAIVAYDRAIELDAKMSFAWHDKGLTLNVIGKHEEALAAYDRAIELVLGGYDRTLEPDLKMRIVGLTWSNKGVALYNLKRYEEAIVAYDRAIELYPKDQDSWYNRHNKGVALHYLKRDEEAVVAYNRALELDSTNSKTWSAKGNALQALGRYEEALAAYDRVLAQEPYDMVAWYHKGTALEALGRYEDALDAYERGAEFGFKDAADKAKELRNQLNSR